MEYTEFCKQLKRLIIENDEWGIEEKNYTFYPDGFTSKKELDLEFIRNTNMRYYHEESDVLIGDYIVLEAGPIDLKSVCRFSLDYLYDEYTEGGWDKVTYIIDNNIAMVHKMDIGGLISHIEEFDFIKDHLIIRPLNYANNRDALYNCIYKKIGDIALVLYLIISEDKETGLNTMKIRTEIFDTWKKPLEEVWETAFVNTQVNAQPRLYTNALDTYKPAYHIGAFMALNTDIQSLDRFSIPCITSTKQTNGAIVMFYPGVKERIAELYNDSYYVAFTSVHDIRTHCVGSISPRTILDNVKHINTTFPKEEILSRKVWFYDRDKKTFKPLSL